MKGFLLRFLALLAMMFVVSACESETGYTVCEQQCESKGVSSEDWDECIGGCEAEAEVEAKRFSDM